MLQIYYVNLKSKFCECIQKTLESLSIHERALCENFVQHKQQTHFFPEVEEYDNSNDDLLKHNNYHVNQTLAGPRSARSCMTCSMQTFSWHTSWYFALKGTDFTVHNDLLNYLFARIKIMAGVIFRYGAGVKSPLFITAIKCSVIKGGPVLLLNENKQLSKYTNRVNLNTGTKCQCEACQI